MKRLYVLVRSDLSRSQQAVQAGHAVASWCFVHMHEWYGWDGTLVYLRAGREEELKGWKRLLHDKQVPMAYFLEPDRRNELTAVAGLGIDDLVKDLPLL